MRAIRTASRKPTLKEQIAGMTIPELEKEIDSAISLIVSGTVKDSRLEQIKHRAAEYAKALQRRKGLK